MEDTYSAHYICPDCRSFTRRRVRDDACLNCIPVIENDPETTALMLAFPFLIISRRAARRCGLTVYRTGKKCN